MTIEKDGEAVSDVEVEAAAQAALSSQEPEDKGDERDYEADAREMGWRPKEEWKGDPANWKDAKTYVDHGDNIDRIVKARVAKIEKDYGERLAKVEKTTKTAIDNIKAQHAKEIETLKAERRVAIKEGDADKVEAIDEQIETLKSENPQKLTGAALEKHNEKVQKDWIASQDWWDVDEDMTAYAIGKSQNIAGKNPDISIEDNLAQVEEALRKKYPEKFGGNTKTEKTGANGHAPVDGGSVFAGGKPKGKTAADIPAEDRKIGMELVRAGAFKDIDAYTKEYFKNA